MSRPFSSPIPLTAEEEESKQGACRPMDFSSQYQYGTAAGAQAYDFMPPVQPLTPSQSTSTGSDDFGHTSPPEGFDAAALTGGDDFARYDYGATGLTPRGLHAAFPDPPTLPPNLVGQQQHSPGDKGQSDDEDMTPAQSRRKAQNRAAQRAFRERKEKHVKDLETKLAGLEAAQQHVATENERLRRDLDKVSTENEILRATAYLIPPTSASSLQASNNGPVTTTGPTEYHPTDFYAQVLQGHASASSAPLHRIVIGDDGGRLLAAGATWDCIVSHKLFRRGLVDVGCVSERLRAAVRCDGQGPVFPEAAIREAIEQSVASGSDDLL
ncbi:Yap1 redox domain [Cordyceps militaris]|uniref:Yap1 redox domain n=1 Tax=Cordyceps militaris TaxID=73501 RepID=A0A2H4SA03_CORMI|nr:Yap1 redox domain [Cordyceps militaris]